MCQITIVIVTFNGIKWINKCLQSVYSSNIAVDIIVVDNLSNDNTLEFVRKNYPKVFIVKCDKNLGFGRGNNIGIEYAINNKSDYVLLLNQDAWIEPDMIKKLVQINQKYPDYWILTPLQRHSINNTIELNFQNYIKASNIILDENKAKVQEMKFANAAIWLISKQCIETVGGFDSLFPHYGEDNDFVRRVHYWGGKLGIVTNAIGYHDRDVNSKRNIEKEIYKTTLGIVGLLKDINKALVTNLVEQSVRLITKSLKYIIKRDFVELRIYNESFFKSIVQLKQIRKHREMSKEKGAFLKAP